MKRLVEVSLGFQAPKELGSFAVTRGSLANVANCNDALPVFMTLFR